MMVGSLHRSLVGSKGPLLAALAAMLVGGLPFAVRGEHVRWTAVKGVFDFEYGQVDGTPGVAQPRNRPGRYSQAAMWSDASGDLWLLGGEKDGQRRRGFWRFDRATTTWSLLSDVAAPVFGTRGEPAANVFPGIREATASWTDADGNLWLFGGRDNASSSGTFRNDLFCFDPASGLWVWKGGVPDPSATPYGVYPELGVPTADGWPGVRYDAAYCTDATGALWLFGGSGYDEVAFREGIFDLWRFDPATGMWTWLAGAPRTGTDGRGVFGDRGVPSATAHPAARSRANCWVDSEGNFWLFGGQCSGTTVNSLAPSNDLWKFNPATREWTWVHGSSVRGAPSVYGTYGTPDPANTPGAREYAASWTGADGSLWLFGGVEPTASDESIFTNELWRFDTRTLQWTWLKGYAWVEFPGYAGIRGITQPKNTPGARRGIASASTPDGVLWIFGGDGPDISDQWGWQSDLWSFDPRDSNWTWVRGCAGRRQQGLYGERGVTGEFDLPGSRSAGIADCDSSDRLLIFGGFGFGQHREGLLNDLWAYDPASHAWTWTSGYSLNDRVGTYGTRGEPGPGTVPGGRFGQAGGLDHEGALWVFGGSGYGATAAGTARIQMLNDLWRRDPVTGLWTWMRGASTTDSVGSPGTRGTPSPTNEPSGRRDAAVWLDHAGNLWMFGGYGRGNSTESSYLNDLWRYDSSSNMWTWMHGSIDFRQPGVYGAQGVPAPDNTPGSRLEASRWVDASGSLWLFGGWGYDETGAKVEALSDLWKYHPASNTWTWMSGSRFVSESSTYGPQGVPSAESQPGSRFGAVTWIDAAGKLWMFGGNGKGRATTERIYLNELWRFDPETRLWAWMAGDGLPASPGREGTIGEDSADNLPGGRNLAFAAKNSQGQLLLFAGQGIDCSGYSTYLADLWRGTIYHRVDYRTSARGRIAGPTAQDVPQGTDASAVTAVPDAGARFLRWSDSLTSATRHDSHVLRDIDVQALFVPIDANDAEALVATLGFYPGSDLSDANDDGIVDAADVVVEAGSP